MKPPLHRSRTWLLAAPLLLVLLAGCSGAKAPPQSATDAPPQPVTYEIEPGKNVTVIVAANKGIIQGTVYTDAGSRLTGARISVVGTSLFADSAGDGTFRFVNVTAGLHDLIVTAPGFQGHRRTIEVAPGKATVVDIVLVPALGVAGDDIPHVHDYWGGRDSFVLVDANYDLTQPNPESPVPTPAQQALLMVQKPNPTANTTDTWWRVPILEGLGDDGPPLVLPGTARVDFELTWNPDEVTVDSFGLAYFSAAPESVTVLGRQAGPALWSIAVNETMDDNGHQQWSFWRFYLYTTPVSQRSPPDLYAVTGSLQVKITLHRGNVIEEPGHRDFWGGNDTLILRDLSVVTTIPTACCQARSGYQSLDLDGETIVPPGTVRMRVEFTVRYQGATGETPLDLDYTLTWKTAALNPQTETIQQWTEMDPIVDEKNHKVWEFELQPGEADAYYQRSSLWEWKPWPRPFSEDGYWLETRTREFQLGVQVWNV